MTARRWTTEQFDEMSWHDNHVYAFRIEKGEWGSGKLTLDIDYIEEWLEVDGKFKFKIMPAALRFEDVTDIQLSLDYKSVSAGICPFSIHTIERRVEQRRHYTAIVWKIAINWPKGEIAFEASGFVQEAAGESVICDGQHIPAELRKNIAI